MTTTARIIVPLYLPKALDYKWAGETPPAPYQLAEVPVGGKSYHGMVVAPDVSTPTRKDGKPIKLKDASPLDLPPFCEPTGQFYSWVSRYNFSYPGEGLRAALIGGKVPERPSPQTEIFLAGEAADAKTDAQRKVVHECANQTFASQAELARAAGVSAAVVRGLLGRGVLKEREAAPGAFRTSRKQAIKLGPEQESAAGVMKAAVTQNSYSAFLLDGVTGSGKTEVYFDVIEDILETSEKGQVLVLLPEIALTPQWMERFEKRFGTKPHPWHSSVSERQRKQTWWDVFYGTARVVVGARSALFLPFTDLKYIVVDEEHDASYKQEEGFRYNGRDMAIVRAKLFKCPVALATATPSLETWHNAQQGRYKHLVLPSRYGGSHMPDIHLIDLTKDKPPKADRFISPTLEKQLREAKRRGEQSMLFLNRRGYAPLLICRGCGHRVNCPSCSTNLVVHGNRLRCHHCGFAEPMPDTCPKCHKEKSLHPFGPGTRKIMAEVKALMPEACCAVVDRDSVTTTAEMQEVVTRMEAGEIDILIGTQMLAKGHDFSKLTLVGVLDADMSLAQGDLRALERTFQLLTQVAGRAGRREQQGQVYLQTHSPDHPLFAALQNLDREGFLNLELKSRKASGFPPFGRLTGLIVSCGHEHTALNFSQMLAQTFPGGEAAKLYGPAPAPLYKLRDSYRYRLLLQTKNAPHQMLQDWLKAQKLPKGLRLDIDIDPQSFF